MNKINFKFGLFLILSGMFIMSYLSCKKKFDREILINESILRLSPRNVQRESRVYGERLQRKDLGVERKRPYIPPEGKLHIEPKDPKKKLKDVVNIDLDVYGIVPADKGYGLKAGMVGGGSFYLGLDKKFIFANRWGVIGGFGYRTDFGAKGISPDAGISYRIDRGVFHNTEFAVTYVPLPKPTAFFGVRINL